jgi:F-type H+-transporting ATPase subunit epsilon
MATFHFDLVSPEKLLYSGDGEQVDVPGIEGDFGMLTGNTPMVGTLRHPHAARRRPRGEYPA